MIGGGRGIGRATATRLASAGARVVPAARTASELEEVAQEIRASGGEAIPKVVDVTRIEHVQALAEFLAEAFGRVDVLVNSAGVSLIAPLEDTDPGRWDLVLDTNLKGPFFSIRAMLDLLRASDGAQVVNIASKVGLTGHKFVSAYTAAKAGLIGLSRALADELREDDIRVAVICPGPVDTPMRWAATPNMDPGLTISASTVAEAVLFLVTLDRQAVMSEMVLEAITYDERVTVPIES